MGSNIEWVMIVLASYPDASGGTHEIEKTHFETKIECSKAQHAMKEAMYGLVEDKNFTIMCIPARKELAGREDAQNYIKAYRGTQSRQSNMDYYLRPPCPYEYCGDK